MIVIGIDPGTLHLGWGVLRSEGNRVTHLGHGVIDAPASQHLARRLCALGWSETAAECDAALCELIREERGVELNAIEGGDGFKTLWSERPEPEDE